MNDLGSAEERRPMEDVAKDLPTKSAKIRALAAAGYSRSEIAKFLGVRYQYARNVLVQAEAEKAGKSRVDNIHIPEEFRRNMDRLTDGLPTKSAKILALGAAGYSRSEIARYLGIRYQHVRNVLVRAGYDEVPSEVTVEVGSDGHITIPSVYRKSLGIDTGDLVIMKISGGELRLLGRSAVIAEAKARVRRYLSGEHKLASDSVSESAWEVVGE